MTSKLPEHSERIGTYASGHSLEGVGSRLGTDDVVKLCSEENPPGPSPAAVRAVREASADLHRYPDSRGDTLRDASWRLWISPRRPIPRSLRGRRSTRNSMKTKFFFLTAPGRVRIVAQSCQ